MKRVISALMVLSLSTQSFAGRTHRERHEIDVSRVNKTVKSLKTSYMAIQIKERLKAENTSPQESPQKTFRKILRAQRKLQLEQRIEKMKKSQQKHAAESHFMDVDYDIITKDLDAMDWVLTGAITSYAGPEIEMSEPDIEMEEPNQEGAGFNFYEHVLDREFDTIQLHRVGADLSMKINELAARANYLNHAWFNHPFEENHGLFAAYTIRVCVQNEFNHVIESLKMFDEYRSRIEKKIIWILNDPRGSEQINGFHSYLVMLEALANPQPIYVAPSLQYTAPVVNTSTITQDDYFPHYLLEEEEEPTHQPTSLIVNSQISSTFDYYPPIVDRTSVLQDITPIYQQSYVPEDRYVDTENVMRMDRMRSAQGSIPSLLRHTSSLIRADVQTHENELFNEVVVYLKSMLAQKSKFKRENSSMDEVSNAIYALVGPKQGRDFPNFESIAESTMAGSETVTMKSLLARVWLTIKTYKNEKERDNLKHSLILALGQCIEKDGHRVCSVGKTQRLLGVLQGYLDGVDIDSYKSKTDVKEAPSKAAAAEKEEPKPDFKTFFKNFMITKNSEMAEIAAKPEAEHKDLLIGIVQKSVDEVVDVYGEDDEKIKSVKAEMKSFIDLTFDIEIDYDAIKATPKSERTESSTTTSFVGNAKVTLKKMVDRVRNYCFENAGSMTKKTAQTVSMVVQFLRGWASSLFASA